MRVSSTRIFREDVFLQSHIKPWEYGLGDKAYVGAPQIITEWKGKNMTHEQQRFNLTVQHYRGRVEHLISEVVDGRMALCTKWRGTFSLLAAVLKIAVHMVGLQERMKGPRYGCLWPVASVPAAHCGNVSMNLLISHPTHHSIPHATNSPADRSPPPQPTAPDRSTPTAPRPSPLSPAVPGRPWPSPAIPGHPQPPLARLDRVPRELGCGSRVDRAQLGWR